MEIHVPIKLVDFVQITFLGIIYACRLILVKQVLEWKCSGFSSWYLLTKEFTWLIVGQCKSDQFECQNHECVSLSKRCDWRKDCSDGSDEFRCGNIMSRPRFLQHKRNNCSVLFNFTAKELSVWPKFSHENFILFYS